MRFKHPVHGFHNAPEHEKEFMLKHGWEVEEPVTPIDPDAPGVVSEEQGPAPVDPVGEPEPMPEEPTDAHRDELIAQYVEKFGRNPPSNITVETLEARLAE